MRRRVAVLMVFLAAGCGAAPESQPATDDVAAVFAGGGGEWIDLTYPFSDQTIFWPTDTLGFVHEELAFGPDPAGYFYAAFRYSAAEHGGTHLDAPIHFAEGRDAADEIPLDRLIGPAVVVDVSDHSSPDYAVTVDDLTAWEATHGQIPDGAVLLVRTGWDTRYGDRTAFLGTDRTGPEAVEDLHFPGLSPEAAQWLVDNRNIDAIGIDTPSVDPGQSTGFPAHVILYASNIPGYENVANLDRLPPTGSYVIALPMKIEGGSGGPLRIVAYVPG